MEPTPKLGIYNYRYGAIAAGISIIFSLMLYFMNMTYDQSPVIKAVQSIIPVVVAITAIISLKKENNGLLTLKQSIKIGVGVFLISGIITLLYLAIFINAVEPDFITKTAALQADTLRETKPELDESIIELQQQNTEKFFYVSFPFILMMNILFGLITGLVTGLFAKKS